MSERIFLDEAVDILHLPRGRRSFLRSLALGGAGAAFSSLTDSGRAFAARVEAPEARVSLVAGADRRDNILHALEPLKREINQQTQKTNLRLVAPIHCGCQEYLL